MNTSSPRGRSSMRHLMIRVAAAAALLGVVSMGLPRVAGAAYVDGTSMMPALQPGQVLLLNRTAYWQTSNTLSSGASHDTLGAPRRGDVVIFHSPIVAGRDSVKRIIGLPGDTVIVEAGQVFVDGQLLDEPYVANADDYTYSAGGQPVVVPDGQYFVLGDNRPVSADSHLGWFVPADSIVGQVIALPTLPSK